MQRQEGIRRLHQKDVEAAPPHLGTKHKPMNYMKCLQYLIEAITDLFIICNGISSILNHLHQHSRPFSNPELYSLCSQSLPPAGVLQDLMHSYSATAVQQTSRQLPTRKALQYLRNAEMTRCEIRTLICRRACAALRAPSHRLAPGHRGYPVQTTRTYRYWAIFPPLYQIATRSKRKDDSG